MAHQLDRVRRRLAVSEKGVRLSSLKMVERQHFKTRTISATGTFASHQSSILRRSCKLNCV